MGIFTALAFWLAVLALTAAAEVPRAARKRMQEKRAWKAMRAVYYPKTTW